MVDLLAVYQSLMRVVLHMVLGMITVFVVGVNLLLLRVVMVVLVVQR